jgi:predicted RND superfamily exporter protein
LGNAITAKQPVFGLLPRPCITIAVTLLVWIIFLMGFLLFTETESNGENLWTPQDTESKEQQKWVLGAFGAADRTVGVYSLNEDGNVLTVASLKALEKLHTQIKATTGTCEIGGCENKKVHYGLGDGVDVSTSDAIRSVLSIWGGSAPQSGVDFLADINVQDKWKTSSGVKLNLGDMLGGVEYDAAGKIAKAKVFRTTILLKNDREDVDDQDKDPASESWEVEFDKTVMDFSDPALKENYPKSVAGNSQEAGAAIRGDLASLSIGYVLLIGFSLIVLSHYKLAKSNMVISLFSVLSVAMASTSSFGVCAYLGVKQNPVVSVIYLLLLGIGMDDTYVIMGALVRATSSEPEERVTEALQRAGASISVTSITNIVAFAAGMTSSLPALRDFCIFASMGIVFDFFYQCTFLVAIIYYRTKWAGPDFCCCCSADPERTGCCVCGLPICSREGRHVCCPCTFEEDGKTKTVTQTVLNRITKWTLTPIGNVVVLVCTLGLMGGAASGLPSLKMDFDRNWFIPPDSHYSAMFAIEERDFPQKGGVPFYVFTKGGNYAAAHSDGSLSSLYERMRNCEWVHREIYNWYESFVQNPGRAAKAKVSDAEFAKELKQFLTPPSMGARFAKDVIFSMNGDQVVGVKATRAFFQGKETKSGGDDVEFVKAVRECADDKPLDAFAFNGFFLYFDGYAVVGPETIQNIIVALLCVVVICTALLGDFLAAFLVVLMVAVVDFCLLGYMAHWELDFNSVTAINAVIAVGLAVDYSAHIAHSFLLATGSRLERVTEAVDHIGSSVMNGAVSTLLAVLPLGLSKSYVFTVFFRMWFMIVLFGSYMGIIVLPVVLRWVGPPSYGTPPESPVESDKYKEDASSKVEVANSPGGPTAADGA